MQCLQSALKPGKDFNNINVAEGYSAFYRVAAKGLTQEIEYRAERPVWPIIPVPVLNFLQPLSTEVSDMTGAVVSQATLSLNRQFPTAATAPPEASWDSWEGREQNHPWSALNFSEHVSRGGGGRFVLCTVICGYSDIFFGSFKLLQNQN